MARRASTKPKPIWFLIAFVILGLAMGGGFFLFQGVKDPYRTVPPLNIGAYMDNANSLRGNTYKIEGTIHNSLGWSHEVGRVIAVMVGPQEDTEVIPILVPADFNNVNLQKGQKFFMKIEIIKDGVIKALDLRKS